MRQLQKLSIRNKGRNNRERCCFCGHIRPFHRRAPRYCSPCKHPFETLYVSVCPNPGKQLPRFSLEQRLELIRDAVRGIDNVRVAHFEGLLVEHCRLVGADCIVRGIRSGQDVEYERMLEAVNKKLDSKIETVFLLSKPEYCHISSSLVRQLMDINIGIEDLVPNAENGIFKRMND